MALSATAALADPAIIFDLGGKFDKSFNEAAFQGAQRWADETGGSFREIELQNEAQREQALRRFAEAGSNPIVMAGFAFADALGKVSAGASLVQIYTGFIYRGPELIGECVNAIRRRRLGAG